MAMGSANQLLRKILMEIEALTECLWLLFCMLRLVVACISSEGGMHRSYEAGISLRLSRPTSWGRNADRLNVVGEHFPQRSGGTDLSLDWMDSVAHLHEPMHLLHHCPKLCRPSHNVSPVAHVKRRQRNPVMKTRSLAT